MLYRRSGSDEDLPEYPTTARVHVEIGVLFPAHTRRI
jgi:hypothetical protein